MPARVRKLIGGVGIVAFVIAYAALAVTLSAHLPKWAELPYYLVVGVAWGLPIIPLITWMNRGR
jgi:hypothetical protein